MPSNACCDFFESNAADPKSIAKKLQAQFDASLEWQQLTASRHSPGVVQDDEVLYRQVLHPVHIDPETNSLKPTAFDDAANKGLSVDRASYRDLKAVIEEGVERIERQKAENDKYAERRLCGIGELKAGDIRAITDDSGRPGFGVYDTALIDNRAHADVFQLAAGPKAGRSVRSKLLEAVKQPLIAV